MSSSALVDSIGVRPCDKAWTRFLSIYIVAPMLVKLAMKGRAFAPSLSCTFAPPSTLSPVHRAFSTFAIFETEGMDSRSPESIADWLSCLPSLSSLEIKDEARPDGTQLVVTLELLTMMIHTPDPHRLGFLPMFTGLELKCGGDAEVMDRDLARDLIITRWQFVGAYLALLCYVDTDIPLGSALRNKPLPY